MQKDQKKKKVDNNIIMMCPVVADIYIQLHESLSLLESILLSLVK